MSFFSAVKTVPTVLLLVATPLQAQDLVDSARTRLADYNGSRTVAGLDSAVEVRRDRWGVPHIYARTQHDLFFAQGYVAAQDRLWQMEMWRRRGDGRLAEVLGPEYVERDRIARLVRYRGDPRAEWRRYAPDAYPIAQAFVSGVNAYIQEAHERPPIEFTLLGFLPEPWSAEALLARLHALPVTVNAGLELVTAERVAALGAAVADSLFPVDPPRALDPAPLIDLQGLTPALLEPLGQALSPIPYDRNEGSNNWVVSGRHTVTGKPLLANDPHRQITLPSLRYLVHLVGPGWNVIGAGEPALPGLAGGHNEQVGFGFTIVTMDQNDLYVERLAPCERGVAERGSQCYRHNGAWRPVRLVTDTIPVRGEPTRIVTLAFTVHGPIVAVDSARGRAVTLKSVSSEPGTAPYLAQLSLNRVRDWRSFLEAAARWLTPSENLVYADTAGNIGWVAAGLMPERHWSGRLPVPGDGGYEWAGFRPLASLPQAFNPASGILVTANNNILPAGYRRQISYSWAPSFRAQRIREVLTAGGPFDRRSFERLQHDEFSIPASRLVPVLLDAARRRAVSNDGTAALEGWDFVMHRDQAAPLVYTAWLEAVGSMVMRPRLAPLPYTFSVWDVPQILRLLTAPDGHFGTDPAAGRDSLAVAALDVALTRLRQEVGADPRTWRWGAVHRALFHHPLAKDFDLPDAMRGGEAHTVNATRGPGFLQSDGASFRMVLDLADWDNSTATTTPGQSGQPGSEYYGDRLEDWAEGRYFPLVYSRAAVEKETRHVLWLYPNRATQ